MSCRHCKYRLAFRASLYYCNHTKQVSCYEEMVLLHGSNDTRTAIQFEKQVGPLGFDTDKQVVEAKFVSPEDVVIEIRNDARISSTPLKQSLELNRLHDKLDSKPPDERQSLEEVTKKGEDRTIYGFPSTTKCNSNYIQQCPATDAHLTTAVHHAQTNLLLHTLSRCGPPSSSSLRHAQSLALKISSALLSCCFLTLIIMGALFTSIPEALLYIWNRLSGKKIHLNRPFLEEERRQQLKRTQNERDWLLKQEIDKASDFLFDENKEPHAKFNAIEGGPDKLIPSIAYYARREGLDCETHTVETEDGFVLDLYHLFNPLNTSPASPSDLFHKVPQLSSWPDPNAIPKTKYKYPVLLIPGLLQSPGSYICNGPSSLAILLAHANYDVWLATTRAASTHPRHTHLSPSNPLFWSWTVPDLATQDLPALIGAVLSASPSPRLALLAHSQGTAQVLLALARSTSPSAAHLLAPRISIACLLAPAACAGPLLTQSPVLRALRCVPPRLFRAVFGVRAFVPLMVRVCAVLPPRLLGALGYRVFRFLFGWSDARWDRALRDRFFLFSPVYVSTECVQWWVGRDGFAARGCILGDEKQQREWMHGDAGNGHAVWDGEDDIVRKENGPSRGNQQKNGEELQRAAWFGENTPPFAVWIGGADALVDGKRLLERFEGDREPFVKVIHSHVIDDYEHLDVLWAINSPEMVGKEVVQCIWDTIPEDLKPMCKSPFSH